MLKSKLRQLRKEQNNNRKKQMPRIKKLHKKKLIHPAKRLILRGQLKKRKNGLKKKK